jgi:hypothetical protein
MTDMEVKGLIAAICLSVTAWFVLYGIAMLVMGAPQ